MTQYARGVAFERVVAARLTEDGYFVVRAAGSHGKADLVALKPMQAVLIQCKLGGPGDVGPKEWNDFLRAADDAGALALIASRPARGVIAFHLMTGYKAVRTKVAPCQPWVPDEVARD